MEPFERFKKTIQEGNLWIYVLSLAKNQDLAEDEIRSLILEKFGFLAPSLLLKRVVFLLKNKNYLLKEKYKGKKAIKTTPKGEEEIRKLKNFLEDFLQKIKSF